VRATTSRWSRTRVESAEADRARRGRAESEQRLDDGGLARAVGSEQRETFAVVDVQRHVVDRAQRSEVDDQFGYLEGVAHDL
jgi:hypothetical protein